MGTNLLERLGDAAASPGERSDVALVRPRKESVTDDDDNACDGEEEHELVGGTQREATRHRRRSLTIRAPG